VAASETNLKRQYGLMTAIALLVGQVIAVGIFLTPAGMAKSVGSPFLLLVVWLVMGAMSLSGALCYGELASRFPEAGGSYVYLREAYGRPVAFLYGWMVLLVLDPGLTAVFAIGLTSYIDYVVPLSDIAKPAIAIAAVVAAAVVNIIGAGISSTTLKILTAFKVGVLLFIIIYSFPRRPRKSCKLLAFLRSSREYFRCSCGRPGWSVFRICRLVGAEPSCW
jgi:APA family basic amino acid/polyamine antiporter